MEHGLKIFERMVDERLKKEVEIHNIFYERKRNNTCNIYYQATAREDIIGKQEDVLYIYRFGKGIR